MGCLLALRGLLSPSYCCYGPMTIVIPLVTVVMLLFSVYYYFIFCLKLPCITIYKHTLPWIKHPCSTRDLGPPRPSFLCLRQLLSPGSGLSRRPEHLISHQLTTTYSSISITFCREMFLQPARGRKCFPRVCQILNHGFLCYRNKQTYFSSAKMCWL